MDLNEFRKNLRDLHKDSETLRWQVFFGKKPVRSQQEIREIYSDLFTLSTIGDLEKQSGNSSDQNETEQKGRRNLLRIARRGHLEYQTREIDAELGVCLDSVRIDFQGEILNSKAVLARIKSLPEPELRNELFNRLAEAENVCADLFKEKALRLRETAQKFDFESLSGFYEEITRTDFQRLRGETSGFLQRTEGAYFNLLARVSSDTGISKSGQKSFADLLFLLEQLQRRDLYLGKNLSLFYVRLLENFGFTPGKIPQIKFKKVSQGNELFCPEPGREIYLCAPKQNGANTFFRFLENFGRAQKSAWTSPVLLKKHPEFVFAPDTVLGKAYGFLFCMLLADEGFVNKHFPIRDEKLQKKILRENKFRLLFESRREALRFGCEREIYAAGELDFGEIFSGGAVDFTNNLGFIFKPEQLVFEVSERFAAQKNLRALVFAVGLREYLRERYDFNWWIQRRAFEELIDIWNTAGRYRAEELAALIGFEMSFELLAESFR